MVAAVAQGFRRWFGASTDGERDRLIRHLQSLIEGCDRDLSGHTEQVLLSNRSYTMADAAQRGSIPIDTARIAERLLHG